MKQFLCVAFFFLLTWELLAANTSAQNPLKFFEALQQKQKQSDQAAQSENAEEDSIPELKPSAPDSPAPVDDPFEIDQTPRNVETVDNIEELPLPLPTAPESPKADRFGPPRQTDSQVPVAPPRAEGAPAFLGAAVEKAAGSQLGVQVKKVVADSPAQAAGIQVGDRLITVAGSTVTSERDLNELMKVLAPGDRIEVELMRDRRKSKIFATLASGVAPASKEIDLSSASDDPLNKIAPDSDPRGPFDVVPVPADDRFDPRIETQAALRPKLGLQVVDVSEETGIGLRKRLRTGAGVKSINAGSPAATAGVPVGALIVGANGRRIEKSADLIGYIATLKPGQTVELTYYDGNRLKRSKVELAGNGVRQAANFQPVAGDDPGADDAVRPVLKGLGKQFPALQRVDNLLDRFSPNADGADRPDGAVQPDTAVKEKSDSDDPAETLREKLRIQQDRNRPLAERFENRKPLIPRPR